MTQFIELTRNDGTGRKLTVQASQIICVEPDRHGNAVVKLNGVLNSVKLTEAYSGLRDALLGRFKVDYRDAVEDAE